MTVDDNSNLNGVFDIYLDVDIETVNTIDYNRNDIASKILSIAPNPIVENFELSFYCNSKSEVSIDICDVMGRKESFPTTFISKFLSTAKNNCIQIN